MDNDKNADFDETLSGEEGDVTNDTSSRARNRTVMLTPEITGEVRARLQQDMGSAREAAAAPAASTGGGGFGGMGSSYSPAGSRSSSTDGGFRAPAHTPQPPAPQAASIPAGRPLPRPAQPASDEYVVWEKEGMVIGFLVSYDRNKNGTVFELRTGRIIVTSEAPGTGNFLVVNDKTVSPMHAIMRIGTDGDIQVLDQLSEFGTKIERAGGGPEEELSGDKSSIGHGDLIWFGERKFHVCLVLRSDAEE